MNGLVMVSMNDVKEACDASITDELREAMQPIMDKVKELAADDPDVVNAADVDTLMPALMLGVIGDYCSVMLGDAFLLVTQDVSNEAGRGIITMFAGAISRMVVQGAAEEIMRAFAADQARDHLMRQRPGEG